MPPDTDVVFVESRADAHCAVERTVVGMRGQYTLESWRDANGNLRQFPCRVAKMTPNAIELAAPVTGTIGDWVIVHFDTFGKFEGPVVRIAERCLVMRLVATADERSKVADKIAWIKDKTTADGRQHERFVPFNPDSILSTSDGTVISCQVIDYSIGGAAVFADLETEIGKVVKIGKVIGRVVRKFPGGLAVEFLVTQDIRSIEKLLTKPAG